MDNGPGTPIHRLTRLLEELDKRFPGVVNPILSDPPEPKYLAAIDALIRNQTTTSKISRMVDEWSVKNPLDTLLPKSDNQ